MSVSRRSFLNATPLVLAPALWSQVQPSAGSALQSSTPAPGGVPPTFPTQSPELARGMVGV